MSQHGFSTGTKNDLQKNLDELNRQMQEKETQSKAGSLGYPYIDLHNFPVDLNVLGMFTDEEAKEFMAVPFYKEGQDLRIGAVDPNNIGLTEKIKEFSLHHKVTVYVISPKSLNQVMKFYAKVLRPKILRDETVRIEKEENYGELVKKIASIEEQKKLTPSELVNLLFGASMFYKSSDIHLEPEEHFVKLRYRVDGVLQDIIHFNKALQKTIVTRLKIVSKLKLNVENVPQDGRITFYYLGKPIDVRVSTLPSAYGEEFVMRLLGTGAVSLKIPDLGFRKEHQDILHKVLNKPQGMIITTGPTGSGKTTSLYAFLNELNEVGVKIITLEDPVEYKLQGIVQTPIDHNANFDFAKGLRAILRQDPDIVMVGEIRDQETAEVAMQAALTGHMVLSTLHTNDASGAIPRLLNMGIKPFVIAPALSAVLAQRLVRRLCEFCKKEAKLAPGVMQQVKMSLDSIPKSSKISVPKNLQFYHSTGCEKCRNLGYSGRVGVYEILENTDAIQKLIFTESSMLDFKKAGTDQGMITMLQDGLLKALEGITDVEEVLRVAGEG